ncbi:MAG: hypothetical protein JXB42_10470 [Deltaproteobacteria bacterium]|nr:hypothetical protein [Deltaproteobacteria bacterium]
METSKIKGLVKLIKFRNGKLRVVDYGIPGKEAAYIALGYIVQSSQFSSRKAKTVGSR